MASVAFHLHGQVAATGEARLFEGSGGYAAGEQRRDFVHVGDVVDVNLWFYEHAPGVGHLQRRHRRERDVQRRRATRSSRGTARARFATSRFPDELKSRYQSFTEADIAALRAAGYRRAVSRRARRDQGLPRRARRAAVSVADKVLVVGPSWVGDMVMAQALYKLLRQAEPASRDSRRRAAVVAAGARAHARGRARHRARRRARRARSRAGARAWAAAARASATLARSCCRVRRKPRSCRGSRGFRGAPAFAASGATDCSTTCARSIRGSIKP